MIGNDSDLWVHEWKDHGTCSLLEPVKYFEHALELYLKPKKKNIKDFLAKEGIKAGEKPILTTHIEEAIKKHFDQKIPQIVCDDTKSYLLEIRICFDKDKPNYRDCSTYTNCNANVTYPYT